MEFLSNPIVIWIIVIILAWVLMAKLIFLALYIHRKIRKPKPGDVDAPVVITENIGDDLLKLNGKTGVTNTDLRPSGVATFEGEKFDVVSNGEYIKKDSPIRVVKIEGRKITVERMEGGW